MFIYLHQFRVFHIEQKNDELKLSCFFSCWESIRILRDQSFFENKNSIIRLQSNSLVLLFSFDRFGWMNTHIYSVKVRCSRSTLLFRSILKDKAFFDIDGYRTHASGRCEILLSLIKSSMYTFWHIEKKASDKTNYNLFDRFNVTNSNVDLILTKKENLKLTKTWNNLVHYYLTFSRCQEHK
jgi:hypothetical protein